MVPERFWGREGEEGGEGEGRKGGGGGRERGREGGKEGEGDTVQLEISRPKIFTNFTSGKRIMKI